MLQLQQAKADLERLDVKVAIVSFQAGPMIQAYARQPGLSWPILLDESRALYRAYGMERGGWWRVFGPHSWWTYVKLLLRGRRLRLPKADVHQLGGDVLIDPEGRIRLHYVSAHPADRPEVESILALVRGGD